MCADIFRENRSKIFIRDITPSYMLPDLFLDKKVLEICHNVVMEHKRKNELVRHGLKPCKFILFVGDGGAGKECLAEAMAGSLNCNLGYIRSDTLLTLSYDDINKQLEHAIQHCQSHRKVFFAEGVLTIETIMRSYPLQVDILYNELIVIGSVAPFELDQLDKYIKKRFETKIFLERPDVKTIYKFFELFKKKNNLIFNSKKMAKEFKGKGFGEILNAANDLLKQQIFKANI